MPKGQDFHLVNLNEVKKMSVRELLQRIADHEKAYTDELKANALRREEERTKQFMKPPRKRTKPKSKRGRRSRGKQRA